MDEAINQLKLLRLAYLMANECDGYCPNYRRHEKVADGLSIPIELANQTVFEYGGLALNEISNKINNLIEIL